MITNYFKSLVITSSIILVGTTIITIFNYFNMLNGNLLRIFESLIPIIAIFIGSFLIGKASSRKGYIEGLKYSGIWIIIFLIINLVTKDIKIWDFIYFLLLAFFGAISAMIGINYKKK